MRSCRLGKASLIVVAFMLLRVGVYNTLSISREYRVEHIIDELNCDILLLTGTGTRAQNGCSHHIQRLPGTGFIVHFGHSRGPYTNRHAGCAIFCSAKYFNPRMIQRIFTPPAAVQGRGGGIRLKGKYKGENFDLSPTVGYNAPPTTGILKVIYEKTNDITNNWMQEHLQSLPARTTPFLGADINSKFGTTKTGSSWEAGTGSFNTGVASSAGESWEQWFLTTGFGSATTMHKDAGPTFYSSKANGTTIDHFIAPMELCNKLKAVRPKQAARRLQIIPDSQPRDHMPTIYSWEYHFPFKTKNFEEEERLVWDFDKLAACLQRGIGRLEFLQDLEKEWAASKEELNKQAEDTTVDRHWATWINTIQRVAILHFKKTQQPAHKTEEYKEQLKQRDNMLKALNNTKEKLGRQGPLPAESVPDEHDGWVIEQTETQKELHSIQKQLRKHRRASLAKFNEALEEQLDEALQKNQQASAQRIARLIAGQHRGIRKRRTNVLNSRQPDFEEVLRLAKEEATCGGLSGTVINLEAEMERWEADKTPLLPRDMNIVTAARQDLYLTTKTLWYGQKRKSTPPWSVPSEVLIMALCPEKCTKGESSTTGIEYPKLSNIKEDEYNTAREQLEEVMIHMHRTQLAPAFANRSLAFYQIKGNG